VQRASIRAATPVSLMELLCKLQREDGAWPSQDPEGTTWSSLRPQALGSTGSWGAWKLLFSSALFSLPLSHLLAPARLGKVGFTQPQDFDSATWMTLNLLRGYVSPIAQSRVTQLPPLPYQGPSSVTCAHLTRALGTYHSGNSRANPNPYYPKK
jgi:hypothetical protein